MSKLFLSGYILPEFRAPLAFLKDDPLYSTEKPYYCSIDLPPHQEHLRSNMKTDVRTIALQDIRGHEDELELERDGFQYILCPSDMLPDGSDTDAEGEYINNVVEILKNRFGGKMCFCYDIRVSMYSIGLPKWLVVD